MLWLTVALASALVLALAALALERSTRRGRLRPGTRVQLNTPRPDDQSIVGVVRRDTGRGVFLSGAEYLDEAGVRPLASGDVFVPAYSWANLLAPKLPTPPSTE